MTDILVLVSPLPVAILHRRPSEKFSTWCPCISVLLCLLVSLHQRPCLPAGVPVSTSRSACWCPCSNVFLCLLVSLYQHPSLLAGVPVSTSRSACWCPCISVLICLLVSLYQHPYLLDDIPISISSLRRRPVLGTCLHGDRP